MEILKQDVSSKIVLAMNSTDANVLTKLMKDVSFRVRRAVARNEKTPASVLNILAYDKVLNVSFMALENKNCTVTRCLSDTNHPCVCCGVKENKMDCVNCDKIKEFSAV